MKLTAKEKKAVDILRRLDVRQQEHVIQTMKQQVLANDITRRIGRVRRLRLVDDRQVEKSFGRAPFWK